jgi:hypothetical protein
VLHESIQQDQKVLLHNGDGAIETYAVLDDGSEESVGLPQAVLQLNLTTEHERLTLKTVCQDVVQGALVYCDVSPLLFPLQEVSDASGIHR